MKKSYAIISILSLASTALCGVEVRDQDARLALRNQRFRLTLSKPKKGAIVSIVGNTTGQEFVAKEAPADLFRLGFTSEGDTSGKLQWLSSQSADEVDYTVETLDEIKSVKIGFHRLAGRNVSATCTVSMSARSDFALWRIRVHGSEALRLEQVHFPVIVLRTPLTEEDDDAVVAGLTKGGVFHRPSQWRVGDALVGTQPGSLCAQFACFYSPLSGFYSATRDARGYPKTLVIRRVKEGLEWVWRRLDYHALPKEFDLGYDIAMTTFTAASPGEPADWRDAADIYKAWAMKQRWCKTILAERSDLPNWLKSGPAMARFNRSWLRRPERVEEWLNEYWRKRFPPAPLIVAFWGWEGVGSWISPKYFPPYPSEEGLARYVRAVRSVGGHPFFWPSGYHWAVTFDRRDDGSFAWDDRSDFNKIGAPHAVTKRDGAPLLRKCSWLRGGENAVLCRGDEWTRRWLNDIALEIVKRGGDMVQIDQVVGAATPGGGECYSRAHGHPPGFGLWDVEAFGEQLRSMAAECRKLDPDVVLGFEEPQELFIQQVGIQDYRDYQKQRWPNLPGLTPASVFGYLYHEFLPVFQSNPRAGDKLGMAYCLVNGQIPHCVPQWPVRPSPALVNGDFEEWDGDVPASWSHVKGWKGKQYHGRPYRDANVKHGGEASLRLESSLDEDVTQVSQNIPIGPSALGVGRSYRMRIWFKAEELSQPNGVRLAALTDRLSAKGVWQIPLVKSSSWTQGVAQFTIPQDATFLRVMLHINGPCQVWLDDAVIEESWDGGYRTAMRRGLPPEHDLARRWVELFHGEGRPYLLLGRMLRPPKLLAPRTMSESHKPFPPILLNAYRAPDGSEALVAANVTAESQRVRVEWKGKTLDLEMAPWAVLLARR